MEVIQIFYITDEQYFYIIYAELQQRLSNECRVTLERKSTYSLNESRLYGIEIHYKGIDFPISYNEVVRDLKHKGKDIPFNDIIAEIIRDIKEGIAEQFLKELER